MLEFIFTVLEVPWFLVKWLVIMLSWYILGYLIWRGITDKT